MDITFTCITCGQDLAVDAAGARQLVECPKCGAPVQVPFETEPSLPLVPAVTSTPTESLNEWKPLHVNSAIHQIGLILRSGTQLDVSEFILYPKDRIIEAQEMAAEARKKLGGISTGLGFWGSPGWVIGGSLLLGAVESMVSSSMAVEGRELLRRLGQLQDVIRKAALPIPVSHISNVELLVPSSWIARYQREVEFEVDVYTGIMGFSSKKEKRTRIDEEHWIHSGEPYVVVRTDAGKEITVVWENVEQYFVV